jgi:hypothetical protein
MEQQWGLERGREMMLERRINKEGICGRRHGGEGVGEWRGI